MREWPSRPRFARRRPRTELEVCASSRAPGANCRCFGPEATPTDRVRRLRGTHSRRPRGMLHDVGRAYARTRWASNSEDHDHGTRHIRCRRPCSSNQTLRARSGRGRGRVRRVAAQRPRSPDATARSRTRCGPVVSSSMSLRACWPPCTDRDKPAAFFVTIGRDAGGSSSPTFA
jgi:hypothetical protein